MTTLTSPKVEWTWDGLQECWVDFTRGWAISPHAAGELGGDTLAQIERGDVVTAANVDLLRLWFERRYGLCEGPGC